MSEKLAKSTLVKTIKFAKLLRLTIIEYAHIKYANIKNAIKLTRLSQSAFNKKLAYSA